MTQRLSGVVVAIAFAMVMTTAAQARTSQSFIQYGHADDDRPRVSSEAVVVRHHSSHRVARKHKIERRQTAKVKAPTQTHEKVYEATREIVVSASANLVDEAKRYLGTNPTNRRDLWCGAFMSLVLQRTGHKPGSNLASDYARYGRRVPGPQVGAIAVMWRGKGGGHVGVVSGVVDDKVIVKRGKKIVVPGGIRVVSGNHNNTVAESVYPRSRIYAYVLPAS